jgi:hypothetical protein
MSGSRRSRRKSDGLTNTERFDRLMAFIGAAIELTRQAERGGRKELNVFGITMTFPSQVRRYHKERLGRAADKLVRWIAERPGEGAWLVFDFQGEVNSHFHGIAASTRTQGELRGKIRQLTQGWVGRRDVVFVKHQDKRLDESKPSDFRVHLGRAIMYRTTHHRRLLQIGMTLRERTFASGCFAGPWKDATGWDSMGRETFDLSGLDDLPPENRPRKRIRRGGLQLCLECKSILNEPVFSAKEDAVFCKNRGCKWDYGYRSMQMAFDEPWWDQWVCVKGHTHGHPTWRQRDRLKPRSSDAGIECTYPEEMD